MVAAEGAKWGDFQSLFQLSVGLNSVFPALSAFMGRQIQTEIASIKDLAWFAKRKKQANITNDLIDLSDGYAALEAEFDRFLQIHIRLACVIFTAVSLIGLIVSSFLYKSDIHWVWQTFSVLQMAPFVIGMLYAVFLAEFKTVKLKRRKTELTNVLKDMGSITREALENAGL